MFAVNGVAPSFVVAQEGPARTQGPLELCSRFQIIKTIAWQHSRFGAIAAYARSFPVFDKKNAAAARSAENWPQCSAKAGIDPA